MAGFIQETLFAASRVILRLFGFIGIIKGKRKGRAMSWHVYIVQCKDSKLYTGITNNLERRIKAHNSGAGGKFTKYRRPVKLLHSEECLTKSRALSREARIKSLPRAKKLVLIKDKFA